MLGLMTIQLTGCTHWGEPMATRPEPGGESVRVWHAGKSTTLRKVSFTPDSLVGTSGAERTRMAFARSEIDSLNVRRTNVVGTVLLAGLAVGLVALIKLAIDLGSYANN
jgi:hypothetical protein